MGPGTLPETSVHKHNPSCHLQMQTKALQKGSHMWTWSRSAVMSCGPRLNRNGLFESGKVFYGQTSPNLTFLLEITATVSSGLKRREIFQHVISIQIKSQHLWWYGGAYGMGSLHVLEGTMNAKRYEGFRATCSLPDDVYFREGLVYFRRTMQNHILQLLQQHGFVVEESGCWIRLHAVQIFHL